MTDKINILLLRHIMIFPKQAGVHSLEQATLMSTTKQQQTLARNNYIMMPRLCLLYHRSSVERNFNYIPT